MDYETLLRRARDQLPDDLTEHKRFIIPEAEVIFEGNTTVLRNFRHIVKVIRRREDRIVSYLQRELGTAGEVDGSRAIFKGKLANNKIQQCIESFVVSYVICGECDRPDTHLIKEGRTWILQCDACGAHRTVKKMKAAQTAQESRSPAQGEVIEVNITRVGRKGDGMGRVQDFTVFVPGTVQGDTLRVKILQVSGKIIQAQSIGEGT